MFGSLFATIYIVVFHNKNEPRAENPFRLHPGLLGSRDSHFMGDLHPR